MNISLENESGRIHSLLLVEYSPGKLDHQWE